MNKEAVIDALVAVKKAKAEWAVGIRDFNAQVDYILKRLLNEAAVNRMSIEMVAQASGLTTKRVRILMRQHGLNPRESKRLLADRAAKTLADNAAALGVDPSQIDLMSPLAYLPVGNQLRNETLENKVISRVTELEEVSGNTVFVLTSMDNPEGQIYEGVFKTFDAAQWYGFAEVQDGKGLLTWEGGPTSWSGTNPDARYGSRELEIYAVTL